MAEYPDYSFEASPLTFDALRQLTPGHTVELLNFTNPQPNATLESLLVYGDLSDIPPSGQRVHMYSMLKIARTALQPFSETARAVYEATSGDPAPLDPSQVLFLESRRILFCDPTEARLSSQIEPIGSGVLWLVQSSYRQPNRAAIKPETAGQLANTHIELVRALIAALHGDADTSPVQTGEDAPYLLLAPRQKIAEATQTTPVEAETVSFAPDPFEEFVGLDETISELKAVVKLANHPEIARSSGIDPVQGILLYGPSGVGKSALMQSLGEALDATVYKPSFGEIGSSFVSQQAAQLEAIFETARQNQGRSLIILDEFDGLTNTGNEGVDGTISAVLKQELEKLRDSPQVFFVAASNHVDNIDPNIRASKRLQLQIPVGLPNEGARAAIFWNFLAKAELQSLNGEEQDLIGTLNAWLPEDLSRLAAATDGFSGGEIKALVMDAKRQL
ncbi:MAG: ATP-binding protein, partial [Candidatus Saccharimonadales bacterium]